MFKLAVSFITTTFIITFSAKADFSLGAKPTEKELTEAGSWYCNKNGQNPPMPNGAKGVASFIQSNWRAFKFEKSDDGTFKNTGEFMHEDFKFYEQLNGLVGIRGRPRYKFYEIIRMDEVVLKGV